MQSTIYALLTTLLLTGAVAGCSSDQPAETAKSPTATEPLAPVASAPPVAAPAAPLTSGEAAPFMPSRQGIARKADWQPPARPPRWVAKTATPQAIPKAQKQPPPATTATPSRAEAYSGAEVLLMGAEAAEAEAKAMRQRDPTYDNLQAFCAQAVPTVQVFRVRVGRDTVLVGQQGTRLVVPARAFEVPASSGPVELRLREFYSIPDIVLAGLGTRAGLDLLETGGMLHLDAAADGQTISLRSGMHILVQLPTKQQLPGMQLFEGVRNDANHAPDWRLPATSKPAKSRQLPDKAAGDRWPCLPKGNGTLQPLLDRLAPLSAADVARLSRLRPGNRNERRWWRMVGRSKHLTVSYMLNLALVADSTGVIQNVYLQQGDSVLGKALVTAVKQLPRLRPASYLTDTTPRRRRFAAARGNMEALYTRAGQRFVHIDWHYLLKPAGAEKEAQRSRATFAQQFNSSSTPLILDSGLYYELAAGGLGWINCDRLLAPGPRIEYAVQAPAPATVVALVFKGQRSILASSRAEGNTAVFERVPSGQPATIVALRREKGITYLATSGVRLGQATAPALQFRPVTLEQLRTELASL